MMRYAKYLVSIFSIFIFINFYRLVFPQKDPQILSRSSPFGLGKVSSLAISPDGKYFITGNIGELANDGDMTILWDVEKSEPISILEEKIGGVLDVEFSPDCKYILSSGFEGKAILWDFQTRKLVHKFDSGIRLCDANFSPDGREICIAYASEIAIPFPGRLWRWDISSGKMIEQLGGFSYGYRQVSYTPDGKYLIALTVDNKLRIFNRKSGNKVAQYENRVDQFAISPDGKYIVVVSEDVVELLKMENFIVVKTIKGQKGRIRTIDFSSNGKLIAVGGSDKLIQIYEIIGGNLITEFKGHNEGIIAIKFLPDNKCIISAGGDEELIKWEVNTGKELLRYKGHSIPVRIIALSPDGKLLACGSKHGLLRIWDISRKEIIKELITSPPPYSEWGDVKTIDFSRDNKFLASGDQNGCLKIFMLPDFIEYFTVRHNNPIKLVKFIDLSDELIYAEEDNTIHLLSLKERREILHKNCFKDKIANVDFSKDGRYVFSWFRDGTVKLWEYKSGESVFPNAWEILNASNIISFSPDWRLFLIINKKGDLELYNLKTLEKVKEIKIRQFREDLIDANFTSDGKFITICGYKNTYLYDVSSSQIIYKIERGSYSALYSYKNNLLITLGLNGIPKQWYLK